MKFSIVIPVYNVAPYLRECLDSVLAAAKTLSEKCEVRSEKCETVEVICVDDGSTDGSGEILDEYAERSEKCEVRREQLDGENFATTHYALPTTHFVVLHQPNAGVSAARNRALDVLQGDWILFVDADDLLASCALKHIAEGIRRSPRADVIAFQTRRFQDGTNAQLTDEVAELSLGKMIDSSSLLDADNASYDFGGKAYRRSIIGDTRFYPYSVGEDQLFLLEVMLKSSCTQEIPSVLYGYRQRGSSAMHAALNPRKIADMIGYNADELVAIERSNKIVPMRFLRITLNWLTEGVSYRFFALSSHQEKAKLWTLWRDRLLLTSCLNKVRGFQRIRLLFFALLPTAFTARILFYMPVWLKMKGLHR